MEIKETYPHPTGDDRDAAWAWVEVLALTDPARAARWDRRLRDWEDDYVDRSFWVQAIDMMRGYDRNGQPVEDTLEGWKLREGYVYHRASAYREGEGWTAGCAGCGWKGPARDTQDVALDDALAHNTNENEA